MDGGVVSFAAEWASTLPILDLGIDVLWMEEPSRVGEALSLSPVQVLVIPIDVSSSDRLLSTLLAARAAVPKVRVLLLCCTPGQSRVMAEMTGSFPPGREAHAAAGARRLTVRQARVLSDIKAGMTNREIAISLGVSLSTVNRHVEHILRKLGVRNRAQAAAHVAEER